MEIWKLHNSQSKSERWKTQVAIASESPSSAGAGNGFRRKTGRCVRNCPLETVRTMVFSIWSH